MRLPSGSLSELKPLLDGQKISLLGCLSFEERCTAVPIWLRATYVNDLTAMRMIYIVSKGDVYPDYTTLAEQRSEGNRVILRQNGINIRRTEGISHLPEIEANLFEVEDELLDIYDDFVEAAKGSTVIFDITSFPKRYFCLFVKRLMQDRLIGNVIVTYTSAGSGGYAKRLAFSPQLPDHLPGFPFAIGDEANSLVVSVGFELLGMRPLVESYLEKRAPKFILSIAEEGLPARRQWTTLKFLVDSLRTMPITDHVAVIATWDAERVFQKLNSWHEDSSGMVLAPFGPKPHTLGMAIFATANDSALVYTQPRSYNPLYTQGVGSTRGYVLKWDGLTCYNREVKPI